MKHMADRDVWRPFVGKWPIGSEDDQAHPVPVIDEQLKTRFCGMLILKETDQHSRLGDVYITLVDTVRRPNMAIQSLIAVLERSRR